MIELNSCPVCSHSLEKGQTTWHRICLNCGYEGSLLDENINKKQVHETIDEGHRELGLESLRKRNFSQILKVMSGLQPNASTLLEVGSAHAWFLQMAMESYHVNGIEPDQEVMSRNPAGLKVRNGYFPDVLEKEELFDFIVFNDVFEHIPNPVNTLTNCFHHLNKSGHLVLNLPSSDGFFYKLGKLIHRSGINGPFARMWQEGMPSPHLHYFNKNNLTKILENNGFKVVCRQSLPSITINGLWDRISYAKSNKFSCYFTYICVVMILPFLKVLPKDIILVVATPQEHLANTSP
jgi:SAM-dependent methyltransferase